MKLTLSPESEKGFVTVSVSNGDDHANIEAVMDLLVALLVAWGYDKDVVIEAMRECADEAL